MSEVPDSSTAEAFAWQDRAACREADPSLFFHPEGERGAARAARVAAAKEVCGRCVVQAVCAEWALGLPEPYGTWGGLTEAERDAILSKRRRELRAETAAAAEAPA